MIFRKQLRSLSVIIFCLASGIAIAQPKPSDRINLDDFDKQYLEHLTKIKVDSVRKAHGLQPLINDSILYTAACDHANYLLTNNKTGHFEDDIPEKYSPQHRVEWHGGTDYISGENVISSYVHKKVKPKAIKDKNGRKIQGPAKEYNTYDELATALCIGWVNSPPHFKNMRGPQWIITGLCIQLDPKTKIVKGVQKFGHIPLKFEYDEDKEMFPYSTYVKPSSVNSFDHPSVQAIPFQKKLPHKLKSPKKLSNKIKQFIKDVQNTDFYKSHRGKYIDMTMFDPKKIQKVFKKKKNGVAVEIVEYAPYHCGNPEYYLEPSRRNKKSAIKGKVLKPVFKKELLKGFDPEHDEQHTVTIGIDPKDQKSFPEFNILFLYKKKVSYVMHFVGACGSPYELYKPQEMYSKFAPGPLEFETFPDSATIKVDFKRNQTVLDSVEFQAIRDSVPREQISIQKCTINAFSSIEGTEEINLRLMKQRADNMHDAMKPYLQDSTKLEKNAAENWKRFYEQIKGTKFAKLGSYPKEKLKEMLSDTIKRKRFDDFLFDQRIAEIRLHYTSTVKDSAHYILEYYNSLVANMQYRKKASAEEVDMLNRCHAFLYRMFSEGKLDTNEFVNMNIPAYEELAVLQGNHAWTIYEMNKDNPDWQPSAQFIGHLKNAGMSRYTTALYQYNMIALFVDKWTEDRMMKGSLGPEQMGEVLDSLRPNRDGRLDLIQLQLNYHFKAAYYYFQQSEWDLRDKSAQWLYNYYKPKSLTDATALKLGRAFTNLRRGDLGARLLAPYATRQDPDHEILALYLKLTYVPVDNRLDEMYFRFLMGSYNTLGKTRWCKLFLTACSISFQAFDYEPLRNFYCEKCEGEPNEATKSMIESMKKKAGRK